MTTPLAQYQLSFTSGETTYNMLASLLHFDSDGSFADVKWQAEHVLTSGGDILSWEQLVDDLCCDEQHLYNAFAEEIAHNYYLQ